MVISGGTATLLGPIAGAAIVVIMKYVVSAYVVRWNLVLGVIFVAIISFMPEGLVPGSVRIWSFARRRFFTLARLRGRVGEGVPPQAAGDRTGPLPGPPPQAGEGKDSLKPSAGAPP
jgi:branched-chain amino acid transport system permease protein